MLVYDGAYAVVSGIAVDTKSPLRNEPEHEGARAGLTARVSTCHSACSS